jgi:hypothetical protein
MELIMKNITTTVTLIFGILLLTAVNASAVVLGVNEVEVDARLNSTVSMEVVVDDPTEIAATALTLHYNTDELHLVAVASDFFADFATQFGALPGAGTPYVNVEDGKTYIPVTTENGIVDIPTEEIINGERYFQPLLVGPETQDGTMITAARLQTGTSGNTTLFTLTFVVSAAADGVYSVELGQSVINNEAAGYHPDGQPVPMLTGFFNPAAGQDLTDPAVFPVIAVEQITPGTLTVFRSVENHAPTISGTPATTVAEGSAYSFIPSAADIDAGDTLRFSISNKPVWATFNSSTGALTGTPGNDDVGTTDTIVITVTDSSNAGVSLPAFDLKVTNSILPGDLDDSGIVDLKDLYLLQTILSGNTSPEPFFTEADVNDDGKLGQEEIIYIMMRISGVL